MKKIAIVATAFVILLIVHSCRNDKHIPGICYKENIQPILISKCANPGCHNPTDKAGDYNFTTYEGVMEAVKAGKANQSELYQNIRGKSPEMPPESHTKLTDKEVDYIRSWINFGAENSSCGSSSCDTLSFLTYANTIKPIMDLQCAGCHPSGSPTQHSLDSYAGVKASINTGKLVPAIKHTGSKPMPQGGGKLSDCDIAKIDKWIKNGMPE